MPSRRVMSTMKRAKPKRISAITWLVLASVTIMLCLLFFMHVEGMVAYSDIASRVKHSTENIPKFYHSLQGPSALMGGSDSNTSEVISKPDQYTESEKTISPPVLLPHRMRVAFAITITKDGSFQDGAAVMQYSILQAFANDDFEISFVAFVHPNVSTSRPMLRKIGYRVIEAPTPVNVSAIKGKFLRDHINDKAGCCGAAELIKLYAYRLVDFDWVVHLDADVLITQSFRELFDMNKSLIYTTDPNMASHKGEDKMPVQGGFLVIKPSLTDYRRIVDIVVEGDYRGSAAWGGTKIGWFWGGRTIQGVLAYYYTNQTAAWRSVRLDRCRYNTMADTEKCAATSMNDIKSAHFTVCQKPWNCLRGFHNNLCKELHTRWHAARKETEKYFGIQSTLASCEPARPGSTKGPMKYTPLSLEKARIPDNARFNVPPLVGPYERMDPLPGGGFVDIDRGMQQIYHQQLL